MQDADPTSPASPGHTKVEFSKAARQRLFKGVEVAAAAVGATMGPHGKTVLIQRPDGSHVVTKDGVSVSKAINLADPVERMGANLCREAASQTNDLAGDGTTTSTVLTHALVSECLKYLDAGIPATSLIAGLEQGLSDVLGALKDLKVVVQDRETLVRVAAISANNDRKIGELIAIAMDKVGRDGVITVEDAKGLETTLNVVEGLRFERGYLSPYFVTSGERMHALYQDAYVYITDRKLKTVADVTPILEAVHENQKPVLIIADDVEEQALHTLVVNRTKAKFPIVAIKAPGHGETRVELLKDLCILTGATLISNATGQNVAGLTTAQFTRLMGHVKKLVVDARTTTLVADGETKAAIAQRIEDLTAQSNDITLDPNAVSNLRVRIARLSGGVAVIKVGGATEVEMIERKYRIEDALHAVRAAVDEGIVAGGGTALVRASQSIRREADRGISAGLHAIAKACEAPLRRIVTNADGKPDVVLDRVMAETDPKQGYNAKNNEFVDMFDAGVIDPVKVTRLALTHAVSVAKTFASLDAVVFIE